MDIIEKIDTEILCGQTQQTESVLRQAGMEIKKIRNIANLALHKAKHSYPHNPDTCETCRLKKQLDEEIPEKEYKKFAINKEDFNS